MSVYHSLQFIYRAACQIGFNKYICMLLSVSNFVSAETCQFVVGGKETSLVSSYSLNEYTGDISYAGLSYQPNISIPAVAIAVSDDKPNPDKSDQEYILVGGRNGQLISHVWGTGCKISGVDKLVPKIPEGKNILKDLIYYHKGIFFALINDDIERLRIVDGEFKLTSSAIVSGGGADLSNAVSIALNTEFHYVVVATKTTFYTYSVTYDGLLLLKKTTPIDIADSPIKIKIYNNILFAMDHAKVTAYEINASGELHKKGEFSLSEDTPVDFTLTKLPTWPEEIKLLKEKYGLFIIGQTKLVGYETRLEGQFAGDFTGQIPVQGWLSFPLYGTPTGISSTLNSQYLFLINSANTNAGQIFKINTSPEYTQTLEKGRDYLLANMRSPILVTTQQK